MSLDTLPVWPELTREERLAIVVPLWTNGMSAGDIAFRFTGATRSAVIGLVHRAKLGRAAPRNSQVNPKPRALPNPRKPKVKQVSAVVTRPIKVGKISGSAPPLAEPKEPTPDVRQMIETYRPPLRHADAPLSILQLPNRDTGVCRFPVLGGYYCGVECGDERYCPDHEQFMYSAEALERIRKRRSADGKRP